MVYLNAKTSQGIETIDEINPSEYESKKAYREALKQLIKDYHETNIFVYMSSRSTNFWRNK